MMGFCLDGRVVRTGGASEGDVIVQVGEAPIEAAAILATEAAARLANLEPEILQRAREAIARPGISVVDAALFASEIGATALHDPTEGGLSAGLYELADASGVRIVLEPSAALWFEPGRVVCAALGIDPWGALASGALLAAFPAQLAKDAMRRLEDHGTPARIIGKAVSGNGVVRSDGSALAVFARDEVARVLDDASSAEIDDRQSNP
jgi:hydrogenase expression/formation protein HypE